VFECGHAVQHAKGYEWLKMRSILVPFVGISSNLGIYLIIGGIFLMGSSPLLGQTIFQLGILGFATGTLFSFVTLPVEFDASNRAIYWLERKRIVNQRELIGAKNKNLKVDIEVPTDDSPSMAVGIENYINK
jgi:hypothetical protein